MNDYEVGVPEGSIIPYFLNKLDHLYCRILPLSLGFRYHSIVLKTFHPVKVNAIETVFDDLVNDAIVISVWTAVLIVSIYDDVFPFLIPVGHRETPFPAIGVVSQDIIWPISRTRLTLGPLFGPCPVPSPVFRLSNIYIGYDQLTVNAIAGFGIS